jgi:hypothetical protein
VGNPLLEALGEKPQEQANPLIAALTPNQAAVARLKSETEKYPKEPKEEGFLRRMMRKPVMEQVSETYAPEQDDSTLTGIAKGGARAILGIPSLALGAVDELSKETAVPADDASFTERIGAAVDNADPRKVLGVAKRLFLDPQIKPIKEGIDEVALGVDTYKEALATGDRDKALTANDLVTGGVIRGALGLQPFIGPIIANTADQISETGQVAGPVTELVGNAALIAAGTQTPKAKGVVEKSPKPVIAENVQNVQAAEPTVRLYRGEQKPGTGAGVPEWVTDSEKFQQSKTAEGRWFTTDLAEAQKYSEEAGSNGRISYVDVPKSVAEKYRAANDPEAANFVHHTKRNALNDEHFLPREIASTAKEIERPTFTTGDQPGPNYTSAELKAFKEKNAIPDEPVQMVGDAEASVKSSADIAALKNDPVRDSGTTVPTSDTPPNSELPPSGEPLPKYAGSINLERLNTPEEVKRAILDRYEQNKPEVDAVRGKKTLKEIQDEAATINMDAKSVEKLYNKNKNLSAEINAARSFYLGLRERVKTLGEKAKDSLEAKLDYQEALAEADIVDKHLQGATAETARAMSSLRAVAAARKLARTNPEKALAILKENLGKDWESKADTFRRAVAEIDPKDTKALSDLVRANYKFKKGEAFQHYVVGNLITNPSTFATNIIGTIFRSRLADTPAGIIAGGIDAVVRPKNRQQFASDAVAGAKGFFAGTKAGAKAAAKAMTEGPWSDLLDPNSSEFRIPHEFSGGLKNPWNFGTRFLYASDLFLRTMNNEGAMWQLATREALKGGKRGAAAEAAMRKTLTERPLEMVEQAGEIAARDVYGGKPNKLDRAVMKVRDLEIPEDFAVIGGLRPFGMVQPFIKTLNRIAQDGVEATPAGLLKFGSRSVRKDAVKSNMTVARAAIGTAVMAWAWNKAASGELTAGLPKDAAARDAFERQGLRPNSVKIAGRWVPLNNAGHFMVPMMAAANMHQQWTRTGEIPDGDKIIQGTFGFAKSLTEQTFMANAKGFFEAVSEENAFPAFWAQMANTVNPLSTMQRNAAKILDQNEKGVVQRAPQGFSERVQSGIPFLRNNLAQSRNALGEVRTQASERTLLPFEIRKASKPDAITKELNRLDKGLTLPEKSIEVRGTTYPLDGKLREELTRIRGELRIKVYTKILASPEYKRLNDIERRAAIDNIDEQIVTRAKLVFLKQHGKQLQKKQKGNRLIFARGEE